MTKTKWSVFRVRGWGASATVREAFVLPQWNRPRIRMQIPVTLQRWEFERLAETLGYGPIIQVLTLNQSWNNMGSRGFLIAWKHLLLCWHRSMLFTSAPSARNMRTHLCNTLQFVGKWIESSPQRTASLPINQIMENRSSQSLRENWRNNPDCSDQEVSIYCLFSCLNGTHSHCQLV